MKRSETMFYPHNDSGVDFFDAYWSLPDGVHLDSVEVRAGRVDSIKYVYVNTYPIGYDETETEEIYFSYADVLAASFGWDNTDDLRAFLTWSDLNDRDCWWQIYAYLDHHFPKHITGTRVIEPPESLQVPLDDLRVTRGGWVVRQYAKAWDKDCKAPEEEAWSLLGEIIHDVVAFEFSDWSQDRANRAIDQHHEPEVVR